MNLLTVTFCLLLAKINCRVGDRAFVVLELSTGCVVVERPPRVLEVLVFNPRPGHTKHIYTCSNGVP